MPHSSNSKPTNSTAAKSIDKTGTQQPTLWHGYTPIYRLNTASWSDSDVISPDPSDEEISSYSQHWTLFVPILGLPQSPIHIIRSGFITR